MGDTTETKKGVLRYGSPLVAIVMFCVMLTTPAYITKEIRLVRQGVSVWHREVYVQDGDRERCRAHQSHRHTVRTPAPSGGVVRNGGSRNSRSHSVVTARRVRAEGTLCRGRENPFKASGQGG